MRAYLLIVCSVILSGCSVHVGMAVHDNTFDSFQSSNPLGIVRGEVSTCLPGNAKLFCEHISGIPEKEIGGYGLNMCGVTAEVWHWKLAKQRC